MVNAVHLRVSGISLITECLFVCLICRLTSFVVKSFCAVPEPMAKEMPLDSMVVERALQWLVTKQTFSGGFIESGQVIDECTKVSTPPFP